jgi:2-haloacid dehalogenase
MRFELVTFDAYCALFDIESSLVGRVADALGTSAGAGALVSGWRRAQMDYVLVSNALEKGHVPFKLVTRRALELALAQTGADLDDELCSALVDAWDELDPWPEAGAVLEAVRDAGYPIAILSNGDEAMLTALASRLPTPFDHIFSAEAAGAYKPAPAIYGLPCDKLALRPERILHVAGSATDVMGAKAAGLTCGWSNRRGDRPVDPDLEADFEFPTLRGLLAHL